MESPDQQPITSPSPYDDPELQAASHGDEMLLDRLVGLAMALQLPGDELGKKTTQAMQDAVATRRRELGLEDQQVEPDETQQT